MPGHVGIGEHDPAVEHDDAARRPRCRRSCGRSPQAAEEDDADRLQARAARLPVGRRRRGTVSRSRRCRRPGQRPAARLRSSSSGGAAPIGSRHWPAGRPRARQAALAGSGFGILVGGLEVVGLDQPGVAGAGALHVALGEGVDHLAHLLAGPVDGHAHHPDGADGQQGQGQGVVPAVELERRRAPRRQAGPSRPGRRPRPSRPRCWPRRGPGAPWCRARSGGRRAPGCRRA